jgi:GNAT superfamily N-acetyltransferase
MSRLLVRPALPADAEGLVPLVEQLGYRIDAPVLRQKLVDLAEGQYDRIWVAEDWAELVGVVSVHLTPLFHAAGHLGRVTAIVVARERRRSGVGALLMERAEEYCWEAGCPRIELTSGDHRAQAHEFYARVGFTVDSRRFIKFRPQHAP